MDNTLNLLINLGIDFGTSYTKVCYRFLESEESAIITFGSSNVEQAVFSSTVILDYQDQLFIKNDRSAKVSYNHLKMRLAQFANITSDERTVISSVSSWYLAKIIAFSRQWIEEKEKDRLIGRKPIWSANIGVPVEHHDSNRLEDFEKVFAVAWLWSDNKNLPIDLKQIIEYYQQTSLTIESVVTDCHAVAEISAAIHSFTTSREAQPGVYVYFDIGAGTVDGVSFNYVQSGDGAINCYAGKVGSLGVEVLEFNTEHSKKKYLRRELQKLIAKVIFSIKEKDPIGDLLDQDYLPVFVGGGGANMDWYRDAICDTYGDFQHKNVGIPPYELKEVPKPLDLEMYELSNSDFFRFSIAYGLSIPYGTLTDTNLPKSIKKPPREDPPSGISFPAGVPIYPNKESYNF